MADNTKQRFADGVLREIECSLNRSAANLNWLLKQMGPYFSITMQDEPKAIASLAINLHALGTDEKLVLVDREKRLIVASLNRPGSLYRTLDGLPERDISYAQFTQSGQPLPGQEGGLELQRFEFDRKDHREISEARDIKIPQRIRSHIRKVLKQSYPRFNFARLSYLLQLLWLNNEQYVRVSPPKRVAQLLWMYEQSSLQGGIYFDVEAATEIAPDGEPEYRVMFAAANPPQIDFLAQAMEVFNRLELGVRRAYCLTISNGVHPYFLGTFYIRSRNEELVDKGSDVYLRLQSELYNTQILSTASAPYRKLLRRGLMTGEQAALVNAMASFCHTNMAHNQPDRFSFADVMYAFTQHPNIALQLVELFHARFDPLQEKREQRYEQLLEEVNGAIEAYNTGHRYLDEIRRSVFRTALLFIRYTLKTNCFVAEKQALAFRLDPTYLEELGPEFTGDLPPDRPFRITFFYGRHGAGYHIGFSDIARGGWRTVMSQGWDDFITISNTIFRENYVLAHTQHLKNKDIYEGGSKMVVVLDAADLSDRELVTRRLYKLQFGFINAFFDIFVTENGRARDPRVVDYYGEDEAIELGPDENMHDSMVELIARQSVRRGYLLGVGVISSKEVGINHKEFGVTSTGVVTFAEIAMQHLGIDIRNDPYSVKFTGGPNGDVAGNAMRLLLERSPQVEIRLIIDGTGALFDSAGADHAALNRIILSDDVEGFDPEALHEGGFIIYRNQHKREGLRQLYRKMERRGGELTESWITTDEFFRDYNRLLFSVEADLFIPAGGRPETIDADNWERFLLQDGRPSTRIVVEGANSFITPAARVELQKRGVVILRDSSANKCGVISSSYEIIANLILSDKEFLLHKQRYVAEVLEILVRRAEEEAQLILKRAAEPDNSQLYTEISTAISTEINGHYARLFDYFQQHPELCDDPLFVRALEEHLPRLLVATKRFRLRLKNLPAKYRYAIIANELASSLVYRGDSEANFLEMLKGHARRCLAA